MIKNESIQQLMDIAQIEDVIGDTVTLKKRGVNYIGLCPFHDEKTPSFTVSPTKGIYKCFGCGASGNIITFLMENEQLSFIEAVRQLARRYNFQLEETEQTAEELERRDERESLQIVTKFASEYYQNNLWETSIGKAIGLSYFKERGFTEQTIRKFELGYAQEGFKNFLEFAKRKKHDVELLKKAGLISEKNDNLFDFFRDRVMFPIHNTSGKVIGFGGRTLQTNNKKIPKYINSGETDIYNKSRVLYGLHLAKKEIAKQDNCFLVEGYTDVISMHQAGVENVVASSGTSLTREQIRLVKRYTKNITLLFDGDQAGMKAALRGVDLILPEDVNVRVLPLPDGQDPDSFIREIGFEQFQSFAKENTSDFILFKLNLLLGESKKDPVARADATKSIIESIALIEDTIKASFYIRECAEILQIEEQILHIEVNKLRRKEQRRQYKEEQQLENKVYNQYQAPEQGDFQKLQEDKIAQAERDILRILIEYGDKEWSEQYPQVIDYVLAELYGQSFLKKEYQEVLDFFRTSYENNQEITAADVAKIENQTILKTIIEVSNSPYELSKNWREKHEIFIETGEEIYREDVETIVLTYKLVIIGNMLKQKEEELKTNEDVEQQLVLLKEIKALKHILFKASAEEYTVQNKELVETHWRQRRNFYLH